MEWLPGCAVVGELWNGRRVVLWLLSRGMAAGCDVAAESAFNFIRMQAMFYFYGFNG